MVDFFFLIYAIGSRVDLGAVPARMRDCPLTARLTWYIYGRETDWSIGLVLDFL